MNNTTLKLDSLNVDVLLNICEYVSMIQAGWDVRAQQQIAQRAIAAFSCLNKRLRALAVPYVFQSITLPNTWDKIGNALTAINGSNVMFENIKILRLNAHRSISFGTDDAPELTKDTIDEFVCVLRKMSKLQTLVLSIQRPRDADPLMAAFESSDLVLPQVKAISVTPAEERMIKLCPNLETIAMSGRPRDSDESAAERLAIAVRAKKLQHLEIDQKLTEELCKAIYDAFPNLVSLALTGGFSRGSSEVRDDPNRAAKIAAIRASKAFPSLRTLILPDAICLGVGFDAPWCGNAYFGPRGRALRVKVQKEGQEAEEMVARWAFEALPQLDKLWVGDRRCATVTEKSKSKGVDKVLAWTWEDISREKLNSFNY